MARRVARRKGAADLRHVLHGFAINRLIQVRGEAVQRSLSTADLVVHLGGVDVVAGSTVLLLFAAGNRDPDQYDQPDLVDLERGSPRHHLAFGHGIHYCVGAALARIEARAVLKTVLAQTRDFALDREHAPRWVDSLLVRRHQQLPITATAR